MSPLWEMAQEGIDLRSIKGGALNTAVWRRTSSQGCEKRKDMAYSTKVIDHYENPRNVGAFDKNDAGVGTGLVARRLRRRYEAADQGERRWVIEDAKFKTAYASAIASSSLVTEWVKGKSLDEAQTIKNTRSPSTWRCRGEDPLLVLAEDAIKAAISDYRRKMSPRARSAIETRSLEGAKERPETSCPPRPQPLNVTPAAIDRVKALLAQRGKAAAGVRIGIRARLLGHVVHPRIRGRRPVRRGRERGRGDDPDRPQGNDVHPRNRDGLCGGQARIRFRLPQSEREGPLRMRRSFHV